MDTILLTSLLLFIEICLVSAFTCTNLFLFLLFFEASALPIYVLIVYCGSPRRERLKASYYFLFFTLYGSISLLLLLLNLHSLQHVNFIDGALLSPQTSYTM
jgi:NADH-quinone oxidoreductase subunit M